MKIQIFFKNNTKRTDPSIQRQNHYFLPKVEQQIGFCIQEQTMFKYDDVIHIMNRNTTKDKQKQSTPSMEQQQLKSIPHTHNQVSTNNRCIKSCQQGEVYSHTKTNKMYQEEAPQMPVVINEFEQERADLLASIKVLKKSAISALAQKADQIEQLRQLGLNCSQDYLQLYKNYINQAEECRNLEQFESRHLKQKEELRQEIRVKQGANEQLLQLIDELKQYIDELEENEDKLKEEIAKLERQIQRLNYSFYIRNAEEQADARIELQNNDEEEQIQSMKQFDSGQELALTEPPSPVEQLTISQLTHQHQEQITKLTEFYQNRINLLRNNYDHHLKYELQQDVNDFQLEPIFKTQSTVELSLKKSKSQQYYQNKHINIYQLSNVDMSSQYSPHNLQEDLIEPDLNEERQNLSQFTKKHFVNPFVKHKSSARFDEQGHHNYHRQNFSTKQTFEKDQSVQSNSDQSSSKDLIWQKAKIFTSGLLSGVSLSTIAAIAMRRKK